MCKIRSIARVILAVYAGLAVGGVSVGLGEEGNAGTRPVCELACELLRNRIESAGFPPVLQVGKDLVYASKTLPSFYERRGYRLAWSGNGGPLPRAYDLVACVEEADQEGLHPEDYHLERIRGTLASLRGDRITAPVDPLLLVDLDLLLTDAFLTYGFHLLEGRLDSETIDPEWHIESAEEDLLGALGNVTDRNDVKVALEGLSPRTHCYRRLRAALDRYRRLGAWGEWPVVPEGGKLAVGSTGMRVRLLRERLAVYGDITSEGSQEEVFDQPVEDAVRKFQRRHGLVDDGIVGPKTLAALNETLEEKIRRIEVNMERWRWLPRSLGERYIRVNIAGYELDLFEAGERIMNMRAVVGRDYRRTPVFSDLITYLVINPYWNVPRSLAVEDKLPLIRENPDYLAQQGMEILSGWASDAVRIDPLAVDWTKVTPENFAWRIRQAPGPNNALGRIKFMFPNRFNVYLHDTPSRELFDRNIRAFSSGCIRIEQPIELAEYLLRGYPEWTRPAILAAVERGVEQTVRLLEPIPVHLLYCTAWVDDAGDVHFRQDVYGRDKVVADALDRLPPTPEEYAGTGEHGPAYSE